jgi:hypothetical protein
VAGGNFVPLDFPLNLEGGPSRGPLSLALNREMLHHVYTYLRGQVQGLNGQVRAINIGIVAAELRWRNTKHRNPNGRNDEILAVGSLLQLDMARILIEPEGVARMVLFYKLVGRLYRNIVFAEIPRLQVDGFRWAPSTFLVNDQRRPHTDLEKEGVDCTENGLIGTYMTFVVADGKDVLYNDTRRTTLLDQERSFDILAPGQVFLFTHIIIYPIAAPQSIKGTTFIAAAVREDVKYTRNREIAEQVDFIGTFQTVLHGGWFRDLDTPPKLERFPNGEQVVVGSFQELKVLLR